MAASDGQALDQAGQDADDTLSNAPVETAVHKCRAIAPENELEGPPMLKPLGEVDGPPLLETLGEIEEPPLFECTAEIEESESEGEGGQGSGGDDVGNGSDAADGTEEESEG